MIERIDQMGRQVQVPKRPERIVSLVPSQTELLYDLGVGDRLVGITKFCVHPKELREHLAVVGGTKNFKLDKIRSLAPDLIIGNKEENEQELIEELASEYPVWMSDVADLPGAIQMIREIGELVDCRVAALELAKAVEQDFKQLTSVRKIRAIYLIWNDPIMVAGQGTFINDMIERSGRINLIEEGRYPTLELENIKALKPDELLLSSEPYPFKEEHVDLFIRMLPDTCVRIVDGEMFSWYGSRLKLVPSYLKDL